MATLEPELMALIKGLAEYEYHHLWEAAVRRVIETYRIGGREEAAKTVAILRKLFGDVAADSYLQGVNN